MKMKIKFPIIALMITLIFVSVLPLVQADSTIVYHKVLQSDDEHFYVSIYVYEDTDSMATEDFYGVKIHVHGVDDDWYGSFNYIWVTIKSYNGITDYWEPVAGYYSGGSIGFAYYGISFSIDIPTEWIGTEGGFTDYIKWGKNMFFTHDDMCSAGFYVPEGEGFNFNITVKAEHCELPPSGSPWLDECSIIDSTHRQLTISTSTGGTTDPAPGTYTYDYCSSVSVTASAYSGYVFDYWLLDGATVYGNPINTTMNADHTLEAHFVKLVNLMVRVPQAPPEGVKVWVDSIEHRAYANTPVSVTVKAGVHTIEAERSFLKEAWMPGTYFIYTFDQWSDGSKDNPRTMHISADTTLTANYMRSKYGILREQPE